MAQVITVPECPSPLPGYPQLSQIMGLDPELGVFRKFGALNAQSLLYYQSQLSGLEEDLRRVERRDFNMASKDPTFQDSTTEWQWLESDPSKHEQRMIMEQVREILPKYNEALIQEATIARMADPSSFDLREIRYSIEEVMQVYFKGPDGPVYGTLKRPGTKADDLVAIRGRHNSDPFSTLVTEKLVSWLYRHVACRVSKSLRDADMTVCRDNKLLKFTSFFTNSIACLLPIACIVVLYSVESAKARLGLIAAFNIIFVFCLSFFTQAKRVEVFTATAAFAAVMVVFVSSNGITIPIVGKTS